MSARVPEHDQRRAAGERLKAALDRVYPRGRGGLRQLAEDAKIGPETLYRWFRGDSEPDLGTLRRVAAACGLSRTELVAAMDDEQVAQPADAAGIPIWAGSLATKDEIEAIAEQVQSSLTHEVRENRRIAQNVDDALSGFANLLADYGQRLEELLPPPDDTAPDEAAESDPDKQQPRKRPVRS